jgi:hypothetical protein
MTTFTPEEHIKEGDVFDLAPCASGRPRLSRMKGLLIGKRVCSASQLGLQKLWISFS